MDIICACTTIVYGLGECSSACVRAAWCPLLKAGSRRRCEKSGPFTQPTIYLCPVSGRGRAEGRQLCCTAAAQDIAIAVIIIILVRCIQSLPPSQVQSSARGVNASVKLGEPVGRSSPNLSLPVSSLHRPRIASPAPAPPSSLFRTGRFGTDKHPFYDPENPFSGTAAGHAGKKGREKESGAESDRTSCREHCRVGAQVALDWRSAILQPTLCSSFGCDMSRHDSYLAYS